MKKIYVFCWLFLWATNLGAYPDSLRMSSLAYYQYCQEELLANISPLGFSSDNDKRLLITEIEFTLISNSDKKKEMATFFQVAADRVLPSFLKAASVLYFVKQKGDTDSLIFQTDYFSPEDIELAYKGKIFLETLIRTEVNKVLSYFDAPVLRVMGTEIKHKVKRPPRNVK